MESIKKKRKSRSKTNNKEKKKRYLRSSIKKKNKRKKKQKPLTKTLKPKSNTNKKKKQKTLKSKKEQAKATRIMTMNRDANRYALIELDKNKKGNDEFVLMNLKVNKTRKVSISPSGDVSCNCFDWKCRCKKLKISCKHILYVLDRILKLEMDVVKDLKVQKKKRFYDTMNRIKNNFFSDLQGKFQISKDKIIGEDDVCAICYTEFEIDENPDSTLECPDCHNLVHKDCMKLWLANSRRKTCVYCRSDKWRELKL
jgi:hypothetical protein